MTGRLLAVLLGGTAIGGAAQAAVTFDPGCNGLFGDALNEYSIVDNRIGVKCKHETKDACLASPTRDRASCGWPIS